MKLSSEQKSILYGLRCPYCKQPSQHLSEYELFGTQSSMTVKYFYVCIKCSAWVGCHKGRFRKAMGRLANARLRQLKMETHTWFDQLWRRRIYTRTGAYNVISEKLNIPKKYCHIGMFNSDTCKQVIDICKKILEEKNYPNYKNFN